MKTALIVVDAWRDCVAKDLKQYPYLEQETKLFGKFINHMIPMIRPHCDIIHNSSGLPIMDEIDTAKDKIVTRMDQVGDYDRYYFCGFHLGKCISAKIRELGRENVGVVLNMSMVFPSDSYYSRRLHSHDTYMYSHAKGFELMATKSDNKHIFTSGL